MPQDTNLRDYPTSHLLWLRAHWKALKEDKPRNLGYQTLCTVKISEITQELRYRASKPHNQPRGHFLS